MIPNPFCSPIPGGSPCAGVPSITIDGATVGFILQIAFSLLVARVPVFKKWWDGLTIDRGLAMLGFAAIIVLTLAGAGAVGFIVAPVPAPFYPDGVWYLIWAWLGAVGAGQATYRTTKTTDGG